MESKLSLLVQVLSRRLKRYVSQIDIEANPIELVLANEDEQVPNHMAVYHELEELIFAKEWDSLGHFRKPENEACDY